VDSTNDIAALILYYRHPQVLLFTSQMASYKCKDQMIY